MKGGSRASSPVKTRPPPEGGGIQYCPTLPVRFDLPWMVTVLADANWRVDIFVLDFRFGRESNIAGLQKHPAPFGLILRLPECIRGGFHRMPLTCELVVAHCPGWCRTLPGKLTIPGSGAICNTITSMGPPHAGVPGKNRSICS